MKTERVIASEMISVQFLRETGQALSVGYGKFQGCPKSSVNYFVGQRRSISCMIRSAHKTESAIVATVTGT